MFLKERMPMATARRELIEAGLSACRQRLEAMGFKRHEADIFTLPLAPRLFGRVGLGKGIHRGDGSMDITPVVGLLHQDVQRVVAACAHLPYHRYSPATVVTNVGRLTPEARDIWIVFPPHESVEEPAAQVCQPISEYGIPWMREHASLAAIDELLSSGQFPSSPMSNFKRPVIAWMLGQADDARQMLRNELKRISESGGPNVAGALAVYERFAAALEERMARGAGTPRASGARGKGIR
jgi:hypothetical protein